MTAASVEGDENPFEFIKLSYEPNPKLSFVANCLVLNQSDKFGRFFTTNRDLKVGDIVAIEKPHYRIIKFLNTKDIYKYVKIPMLRVLLER